jgi:hypothetical protein
LINAWLAEMTVRADRNICARLAAITASLFAGA